MADLTAERLRALLNYDSGTGVFTWITPRKRIRVGDVAGRVTAAEYRIIKIDGVKYYAHRLVWLYVHGEWPPDFIDHINRDRADNRLENLRPATRSENGRNRTVPCNNVSGVKGVNWYKTSRRWVASIKIHGRRKHLGYFDSIDDAAHAYAVAAPKIHGKFASI